MFGTREYKEVLPEFSSLQLQQVEINLDLDLHGNRNAVFLTWLELPSLYGFDSLFVKP